MLDDLFSQRSSSTTSISGKELKGIKIRVASPEKVREWSYGEVKIPETINKRTFKPERDGLFCAKIFGPVKDYECNCGKYKRMIHRGIVCEKCGVEVLASKVRRQRMGHIELATPVSHIWFLKGKPSKIASLLDMTQGDLEKVIYFQAYIVLDPGDTHLTRKQVISEKQYKQYVETHGEATLRVGIGAEVIRELLMHLDLEKLRNDLRDESMAIRSQTKKKKITNRLKIIEAFLKSGNKCEWMILKNLPVIPPELRPLVPLDGGRFADGDINHLYRRVINRNMRLKKLLELNAPEIIINNEKCSLQETVDALLENGLRGKTILNNNSMPMKSLSDMIKGKHGRFRQNLLGKYVDYSGKSVVVVDPNLKLHQCGLPKKMALELFKPFLYSKLEEKGYASTIKNAKEIMKRGDAVVWDILDKVVKEYPVLLNRTPTLHRLGIQAFEPILLEGKAISLHPLVCSAFNVGFDGDEMTVHVPISIEANVECRVLLMSTNNLLSPANGKILVSPSQEVVLGLYYLTLECPCQKGEGKVFADQGEVISAYDNRCVDLHAKIRVRIDGQLVDTTPGRIIIGEILPEKIPFSLVNCLLTKKHTFRLVSEIYRRVGAEATVVFCDKLKDLGFEYSTQAGITIGIKDLGVWADNDFSDQIAKGISIDRIGNTNMAKDFESSNLNPIQMMKNSGASDNIGQTRKLLNIKGIMVEQPREHTQKFTASNFREGLTIQQYLSLITDSHKILTDAAIMFPYFEKFFRRLVDAVQDVVVSEYDCGTVDGIEMTHLMKSGEVQARLSERALGRIAMYDILDPESGEVIVPSNAMITKDAAEKIDASGINAISIRSVLTCKTKRGVCALCYGRDLARGHLVNIGETVGIIAAQSIGESSTQLTMRTFHIGGTVSKEIERSNIKTSDTGHVVFSCIRTVENTEGEFMVMGKSGQLKIVDDQGREREKYFLPTGAKLFVRADEKVSKGQLLAEWDPINEPFVTDIEGRIKFSDIIEGRTYQEKVDETTGRATMTVIEYRSTNFRPSVSICDDKGRVKMRPETSSEAIFQLPVGAILMVQDGDRVQVGDVIAHKPQESSKPKDLVGGLPRVAELFGVRKPKDRAVVTEIDGIVSFGPESKGKRKIIIGPEVGEPKEYLIPKGKHITVQEGDFVEAGELITEGNPDLHDMLRIKGKKFLANYLVEEVQDIYRFRGVQINDKHIEVIVRQMLKKVNIIDPGDTGFLVGQQVEQTVFMEENEKCIRKEMKPAMAEPAVQGITQASLTTESFISAASLQETTKVLTEATLMGKVDQLRGLKENVILGRLIPAGTGYRPYVNCDISLSEQPQNS